MIKNDSELIHQATLRMCRHLRLEDSLFECIDALTGFVPCQRILLQIAEPEQNTIRTIATATATNRQRLDVLTTLSSLKPHPTERSPRVDELDDDIRIVGDGSTDPVEAIVRRLDGPNEFSLLRMKLQTRTGRLGGVVLVGKGRHGFREEDARRFSLFKASLTIVMDNALAHEASLERESALRETNRTLREELGYDQSYRVVGELSGLRAVVEQAHLLASKEQPLMISGEIGVEKIDIAHIVHQVSTRKTGPFLVVRCGAIPDSLFDGQLFGYENAERGGHVVHKRGVLERALGGSVVLDGIERVPLPTLERLASSLRARQLVRIGGTEPLPLNIRLITTTVRDIASLVSPFVARDKCWGTLSAFTLHVPPLRERRADIPELAQRFLQMKAKEHALPSVPTLSSRAIETLMSYDWPGNTRELESVVEREVLIAFRRRHFELDMNESPLISGASTRLPSLDEVVTRHIVTALEQTGGRIHGPEGAGVLLGVNANTLRHRMRKLGIKHGKKASTHE